MSAAVVKRTLLRMLFAASLCAASLCAASLCAASLCAAQVVAADVIPSLPASQPPVIQPSEPPTAEPQIPPPPPGPPSGPPPGPALPCAGEAPSNLNLGTLVLEPGTHPAGVTGRLGFYAAEYDPLTLQPLRAVSLDSGSLYPLASAFKTTVLHSLLRGVDDGRLKLNDRLTTTEAARSIEGYSRGSTTLLRLATRMIQRSENTAADLLALRIGLARIQADLDRLGATQTRVQFTTKAWWSIQAGLVPELFPLGSLFGSTQDYSLLPAPERLKVVRQVLETVKGVKAPLLEQKLDEYFHGPEYDPDLELAVQNTSTPQEYACLNAALFRQGLSVPSAKLFRSIMATGLAHNPFPAPEFSYWGGKPGSGWRLLTLTGYAETPTGRVVAYAYLNDRSDTQDSADMERQIRGVDAWILAQVRELLRR